MSEREAPLPAGPRALAAIPANGATPHMTAPHANVEMHIEELVLHGFPAGARHAIGDAVQRELARLLAERDISPSLAGAGDLERVDGGAFQMASDARPDAIGAQVARAIHGGLSR